MSELTAVVTAVLDAIAAAATPDAVLAADTARLSRLAADLEDAARPHHAALLAVGARVVYGIETGSAVSLVVRYARRMVADLESKPVRSDPNTAKGWAARNRGFVAAARSETATELGRLAEYLAAPEAAEPPTILYHGQRSYSLGGKHIVVGGAEHHVLQKFLEVRRAMGTKELEDSTVDNVARTVGSLAEKFGAAVRKPEKRNDGYHIAVKNA